MKTRRMATRNSRRSLLQAVCGLCCALSLGLVGCGHSGSSVGPGPDRSADFALSLDPASVNLLLKPGQTTPVTLDLVSVNGFPSPITLTAANGLLATFVTPTVPSLPKGTTKVTLNVTVPADTGPLPVALVAYVSATGGGMTRYLNSSLQSSSDSAGGMLRLAIPGLTFARQGLNYSPFHSAAPFDTVNLTGTVPLIGAGLPGPVTVTLTNPNAGVTATLAKSTFTPTGPAGVIQEDVRIDLHLSAPLGGGAYPFTLKATGTDGATSTYTVYLYMISVAFAGPPPTLAIADTIGNKVSVEADLAIVGPPGLTAHLTALSPYSLLRLTITPQDVLIPASGTFTQHVAIEAEVLGTTFPHTYTVDLTASLGGSRISQPAPFTLTVQ
jgi:hypothetical protein